MSKKNKNFNKNFGNEAPEMYSMDDIGYMTDEAIHDRVSRLDFERNRLVSMNKNPYLWEVELAYLHREQELRQVRATHHAEYIKKFATVGDAELQASNFEEQESGLN